MHQRAQASGTSSRSGAKRPVIRQERSRSETEMWFTLKRLALGVDLIVLAAAVLLASDTSRRPNDAARARRVARAREWVIGGESPTAELLRRRTYEVGI